MDVINLIDLFPYLESEFLQITRGKFSMCNFRFNLINLFPYLESEFLQITRGTFNMCNFRFDNKR